MDHAAAGRAEVCGNWRPVDSGAAGSEDWTVVENSKKEESTKPKIPVPTKSPRLRNMPSKVTIMEQEGMDHKEFQEAIKEAAKNMGVSTSQMKELQRGKSQREKL